MEVPRCALMSPTADYTEGTPTAGEAYRMHTTRALNRMCHNQEAVVRKVCYVNNLSKFCPRRCQLLTPACRHTTGFGDIATLSWLTLMTWMYWFVHSLGVEQKVAASGVEEGTHVWD